MRMCTAFFATGLLAISTLVFAADEQKHLDFQSLDKNHDGRLSRGEIPDDLALLKARFASFDHDSSGRLDQGEFIAAIRSVDPDGSDPRLYFSSSPDHAAPPKDPIVRIPSSNGN
jgi:Ca2+-binding EF-hand superfamily protein